MINVPGKLGYVSRSMSFSIVAARTCGIPASLFESRMKRIWSSSSENSHESRYFCTTARLRSVFNSAASSSAASIAPYRPFELGECSFFHALVEAVLLLLLGLWWPSTATCAATAAAGAAVARGAIDLSVLSRILWLHHVQFARQVSKKHANSKRDLLLLIGRLDRLRLSLIGVHTS